MYTFISGQTPDLALNISARIGALNDSNDYADGGSEQWGLVSFAFHPEFASNPARRWVFVLYNARQANEVTPTSYVARYTLTADGTTFDPASELIVLRQPQTNGLNHHFGHLAFGPDGYLYIGSGDGSASFAAIRSQDTSDLRGKLLRIDVDNGTAAAPYAIPPNNPWKNVAGARPELYAIGLRNPWRFSFDKQSGQLWLGDVGGSGSEEINIITRGGNYGWNIYEGRDCLNAAQCATPVELPIFTIPTISPTAIIGGFVYRGNAIPYLNGRYVFAVYGQRKLYALSKSNGAYTAELILDNAPNFDTLFTDADGEIYGVEVPGEGTVYKIVPAVASASSAQIPQLLSETGCIVPTSPLGTVPGMIPYTVNAQLWSDGAAKRRWVALPDGAQITIGDNGDFEFPIGTVLMKMFLYQRYKPFETRLLKRHTDGSWAGYSYEWKADLSDAVLVPAEGKTIDVKTAAGSSVHWHLPSRSQCLLCHTAAAGYVLGPRIAQLNSMYDYERTGRKGHQLVTWNAMGLFANGLPAAVADLPALSGPFQPKVNAVRRARSHLDANCGSLCHRPNVDIRPTMDLRYSTDIQAMNVCNVDPLVSDLGLTGAKLLDPLSPATSLLWIRMQLRGNGQMPPLATTIADPTAVVVENWVNRASVCDVPTDSDGDGVPDDADNCTFVANASQWDSDNDGYGDRCDGDFNNNGYAGPIDQGMITAALGAQNGDGAYSTMYDFNLDGYINADDVNYFNSKLMGHAPGPTAPQ
ncbi:MAG: PQQ-dependent sugar dehydrogenase [Rhodospirillales bacterium]|nr:PQQ-dependent sugar dehydrogenase [Rhodospirillales bacterium]